MTNPIIITYRRTSRLSMRIGKQGEVRVSAPLGIPKVEVEQFIETHQDWIAKAQQENQTKQAQRNEFFAQLPLSTHEERQAATERLHSIVLPLLKQYTTKMNVQPVEIQYKPTISRWGCCYFKSRRIQFSLYLLLLPDWCIEHVVVHELTHLLVPNHGAKFHALLDSYFPRWREARTETRRISRPF